MSGGGGLILSSGEADGGLLEGEMQGKGRTREDCGKGKIASEWEMQRQDEWLWQGGGPRLD